MAYVVLWALVVSVCYVDGRECESKDVYFYDSKEECLHDLKYLYNLQITNQEELSATMLGGPAELKCEVR